MELLTKLKRRSDTRGGLGISVESTPAGDVALVNVGLASDAAGAEVSGMTAAPHQLGVLVNSDAGVQVQLGGEHAGAAGVVAVGLDGEVGGNFRRHADVTTVGRDRGVGFNLAWLRDASALGEDAPELLLGVGEAGVCCLGLCQSLGAGGAGTGRGLTQVERRGDSTGRVGVEAGSAAGASTGQRAVVVVGLFGDTADTVVPSRATAEMIVG